MSLYKASRFVRKHLIFPQEVVIEDYHVRTRKRCFPFFWVINEQSIPLSNVASIKLLKGLFFSDIIIENSGGDYPIRIEGFSNRIALKLRQELEMKERKLVGDTSRRKEPQWAPPAYEEEDESDPVEVVPGVKVHGFHGD
jgi:hypothetical protein